MRIFLLFLIGTLAFGQSAPVAELPAERPALTDSQKADFLAQKARILKLQVEYQALVSHEVVQRIMAIQKQVAELQNKLNAKTSAAGWQLTDDLDFRPAPPANSAASASGPPGAQKAP